MAVPWCAILTVLVFGCHVETMSPRRAPGVRGSVRAPSGAASGAGAFVTVTRLPRGPEVGVFATDASGRFSVELAPGDYAFAITGESGFAFVDKMRMPVDNLEIVLSPACRPLRGRVTGARAWPASVSLSRISNSRGDRFIVPVERDGGFVACLPEATYATRVEGAMVSPYGPVIVPTEKTVEVAAFTRSLLGQVPADIHIPAADLESFARSIHDKRIVGLGEANHGTGDFYTYRGKLSLELARVGTLRRILIEADAIEMMRIDDYVNGADVDLAKAVTAIGFWITDIHEFLSFLEEVRRQNIALAPLHKMHVLGIDAQRIEPPVRLLLSHRLALAISDHEANLLGRLIPDHGSAFRHFSHDEKLTLAFMLDRIATGAAGSTDLGSHAVRSSIAARSIHHQIGYVGQVDTYTLRDRAMAELAAYIANVDRTTQVAVWAHNGHIAREFDGSTMSLGQHLAAMFGEDYYPVAFLSYRGEGRAWDEPGEIGVIPHKLAATPPYNMESVVMTATGFVKVAWVRLDTASGALKEWLSWPRFVREFGSAYHPKDTQTLRRFPSAMAAVVVVRDARSSTPTPTGIRRIAP